MATTLIPVEEYLRTSYPDGDREYVDGEVVERNMGELPHAALQTAIVVYLRSHYPQFWAVVEGRLQTKKTRFRVPDVMLFAGGMPQGRIAVTPPHLVVEVLSPDDRAADVQEKIEEYLAFGVPYVWIIHPRTRQAYVHTAEGARPVRDGFLRAENPDIAVPLTELFA